MSVVLVATIYPVAEHRDEVIAAFEAAITKVHATEEGCELYALHESKDRLVVIEKYRDMEALGLHGQGEALAELGAAIKDKIVGDLDVQVLSPHPAGDAAKGAL